MTQYNHPEDYDGRPLVLDDQRVVLCCSCGSLVLDSIQHSEWHEENNGVRG